MKRGGLTHPKTYALAEALQVKLPTAIGLLEALFHFTAQYAPQGDVGKFPNKRIAAGCHWDGNPDRLIVALVSARWLDESENHRYVVHDWPEHSDQAVKKRLERAKLPFLPDHAVTRKVTVQRPDDVHAADIPPEPVPAPVPVPVPVPRITAASSSNNGVHTEPAKADDDAASVFVAGVRKRWEELQIACGRWTDANEKIAREQFRKGTSLEEMKRVITWGSIMRFKHCRNNGSDGKIVSLQYHVDCLDNDDFRSTTAQQLANMLKRCERDHAQNGAPSPTQEGAA